MSNENIFREIDEELRTDRMRALWRRFAPFVIGGAIAIVALVAINEGWSWYTNSQSAAASEELYAAGPYLCPQDTKAVACIETPD